MLSRHLHALTTRDPYGPFVTALIELKLDQATNFEWQRHSRDKPDVPHFDKLLKFLDLRAQAAESSTSEGIKRAFTCKVFHVLDMASVHLTKLDEVVASQPNQQNMVFLAWPEG